MGGGGGREGASNDTPCGSASDCVYFSILLFRRLLALNYAHKTLNQVGTIYHMGRNTRKPVFGVF